MPKKLTTIDFIEKASKVHNNFYDYSLSIYTKSSNKLFIICPLHGKFNQIAADHLSGEGCPVCGKIKTINSRLKSFDIFIKKANEVHNFKYNYVKDSFKGYNKKISILCSVHGEFTQNVKDHLDGHGCKKCSNKRVFEKNKKNPTGWSLTNWIKAAEKSKQFDSFKVYIIRCWDENEEFYKIGRTYLKICKRFRSKTSIPYRYEIIRIFEGNPKEIYNFENYLKNLNNEYKYIPKIKFNGMYECFSEIKKECLKNNY